MHWLAKCSDLRQNNSAINYKSSNEMSCLNYRWAFTQCNAHFTVTKPETTWPR